MSIFRPPPKMELAMLSARLRASPTQWEAMLRTWGMEGPAGRKEGRDSDCVSDCTSNTRIPVLHVTRVAELVHHKLAQ
jgi:hypothetical protein